MLHTAAPSPTRHRAVDLTALRAAWTQIGQAPLHALGPLVLPLTVPLALWSLPLATLPTTTQAYVVAGALALHSMTLGLATMLVLRWAVPHVRHHPVAATLNLTLLNLLRALAVLALALVGAAPGLLFAAGAASLFSATATAFGLVVAALTGGLAGWYAHARLAWAPVLLYVQPHRSPLASVRLAWQHSRTHAPPTLRAVAITDLLSVLGAAFLLAGSVLGQALRLTAFATSVAPRPKAP